MLSQSGTLAGESSDRYLRFQLGAEQFAMPLLSVREVIAIPKITSTPLMKPYQLGIINLRGEVISILDLRKRFKIESLRKDEPAIILCQAKNFTIGVVVDSVDEVFTAKTSEISKPSDFIHNPAADFISGIFQSKDRLVLVLDFNKIIDAENTVQTARVAGL